MRYSHYGTGKRDTPHTGPSAAFKMRTNCKPIHHLKSKLLKISLAVFEQRLLTGIQVQSETNTVSREALVHPIMTVNMKH